MSAQQTFPATRVDLIALTLHDAAGRVTDRYAVAHALPPVGDYGHGATCLVHEEPEDVGLVIGTGVDIVSPVHRRPVIVANIPPEIAELIGLAAFEGDRPLTLQTWAHAAAGTYVTTVAPLLTGGVIESVSVGGESRMTARWERPGTTTVTSPEDELVLSYGRPDPYTVLRSAGSLVRSVRIQTGPLPAVTPAGGARDQRDSP